MSLGVNTLTDDQLLELLQEACQELAQRDPMVRNLAQGSIVTEAEKLAAGKEAIQEAYQSLLRDYRQGLKEEALAELRTGLKLGTMQLLTPQQESDAIAESSIEARIELIDEALGQVTGAPTSEHDFALRVHDDNVSMSWGGERMHWKAQSPSWKMHELARLIRATFTGSPV